MENETALVLLNQAREALEAFNASPPNKVKAPTGMALSIVLAAIKQVLPAERN